MPAEPIAMHKLEELLRLKYHCVLSHEQIARALSISKGVVAKYVKAAEASSRPWAVLSMTDEAELHRLLGVGSRGRGASLGYALPDFAAVHQGLKQKNVTLALLWEEYVQTANGPAYQYSRFCDLYREFARRLKRSMHLSHRACRPQARPKGRVDEEKGKGMRPCVLAVSVSILRMPLHFWSTLIESLSPT